MTTDEMISAMQEDGYRILDEYKGIRAGLRVHNRGEQYAEARENGTAAVFAVLRNKGSFWERKYRADDVEVVVVRDRDGSVGRWASYGTGIAEIQSEVSA